MKKYLLLLAVGSVILASCASNNTYQLQHAQIDSTVNANATRHDAENVAKNDSTLRAIEKQKADSITNEKELEKKKQTGKPANTPAP